MDFRGYGGYGLSDVIKSKKENKLWQMGGRHPGTQAALGLSDILKANPVSGSIGGFEDFVRGALSTAAQVGDRRGMEKRYQFDQGVDLQNRQLEEQKRGRRAARRSAKEADRSQNWNEMVNRIRGRSDEIYRADTSYKNAPAIGGQNWEGIEARFGTPDYLKGMRDPKQRVGTRKTDLDKFFETFGG